VFSIVSTWDEEEEHYRYAAKDEYEAELIDKCLECGSDLEEMPYAKRAQGTQVI